MWSLRISDGVEKASCSGFVLIFAVTEENAL